MVSPARLAPVVVGSSSIALLVYVAACSGDEGRTALSPDAALAGTNGGSTTTTGSGGSSATSGGASNGGQSSGGISGSGGRAGSGGNSSGGASNTGGSPTSGGAPPADGSAGATGSGGAMGGVPDPTAVARVSGYLTNTSSGLPNYAYDNIKQNFSTQAEFDELVHAIVMSCAEFAPSEANWTVYCEAVLTSAIVAESSYDPKSNNLDSYGQRDVNGTTANDPTVGLLQIRFSSTVQDYNSFGPLDRIAAIGCTWPAELAGQTDPVFWATKGGSSYVAFMQDVSCNIGLAAWYYFTNATGNGGATPIYAYQYCQGQGIAGNMVIGLLSHLMGPGFPRPPDASNSYVTGIKGRFSSLLGGLPSPDPFATTLSPETAKYCR